MTFKSFFIKTTIASALLALIIIILFVLNNNLGDCDTKHEYNKEMKKCFYYSDNCKEGEELSSVEGKVACIYNKKGFLNTEYMWYFGLILGIGWLVIGIVFVFSRMKGRAERKPYETSQFKKEDFVAPKRARELWAKRVCERNNILILGDSYKQSTFHFYNKTQPYQKGKEWRYRFQAEVKEGDNPGIYTIDTSISRGENWILNDGYVEHHCTFDEFKSKRDMPLSVAENPQERMMEALVERHPERAAQIQEQMLEKGIIQPQKEEPEPTQQPQIIARPIPRRYPWQRRRYL